jgi:hypothetical protein
MSPITLYCFVRRRDAEYRYPEICRVIGAMCVEDVSFGEAHDVDIT